MKKFITLLALTFSLFAAHANMDEALAAYHKKDYKTALSHSLPLAEHGDKSVQYFLHTVYLGLGDGDKALYWLRQSSANGFADAQNTLGNYYHTGTLVKRNHLVAYALFDHAAANNSQLGKENRDYTGVFMQERDGSNFNFDRAKKLSEEMNKPQNFLKALDAYVKAHPEPYPKKPDNP